MGDPVTGGPTLPAVLLCGGRGTRLGGDREKPLVEVGGRPMVARVLDALADARVARVIAVASPDAPHTRRALRGDLGDAAGVACAVLDGSGDGYVADLRRGLDAAGGTAVTVAADLPLVRGRDVDDAIDAAVGGAAGGAASGTATSVSVCVPAATKRDLGVSVDASFDRAGRELAPTGLNVAAGDDDRVVVRDRPSLAVNVNRPVDLTVARRLADR